MTKQKARGSSLAAVTAVLLLLILVASVAYLPSVWAQTPIPTPAATTATVPATFQADDLSIKDILTIGDLALLIAVVIVQVVGAIFGVYLLKTAAAKEDLLKTTYERQIAVMEERLALESEKSKSLQELLEERSKLLESREEELARARGVLKVEREALRKDREQLAPPEPSALPKISLAPEDRQRLDGLTGRIDGIEQLLLQQAPAPAAPIRLTKSARDYFVDGYTYQTLDRYEEAIAAYQRAIELDSTEAYPHNGLGSVYRDLGQQEEAIAAYQRAIELDPTDASPHYNLGNVYRYLGRHEEAIAAYQRAIELDPTDVYPHNGLGAVYADLGRQEDAIAACQRAIELDPNFVYPHIGLAGVYRRLGDEPKSQRYLVEAYQLIKPDDHAALACLESIAGNVDAALEYLAKALEQRPGQRAWARRDSDLAFIRDDPRFQELVGEDDRG